MTGDWIGVDFDGTLAVYNGEGLDFYGDPIGPMVDRVKRWRKEGIEVRILTARAHPGHARVMRYIRGIEQWCLRHLGETLQVMCSKDCGMIELWDDRAVAVEPNTGARQSPLRH